LKLVPYKEPASTLLIVRPAIQYFDVLIDNDWRKDMRPNVKALLQHALKYFLHDCVSVPISSPSDSVKLCTSNASYAFSIDKEISLLGVYSDTIYGTIYVYVDQRIGINAEPKLTREYLEKFLPKHFSGTFTQLYANLRATVVREGTVRFISARFYGPAGNSQSMAELLPKDA
jgi:hypothetical protein